MSGIQLLQRYTQIRKTFLVIPIRAIQKVHLSTNSSDSDDNKPQKKTEVEVKSNEALEKLNKLLKTMIDEDVASSITKLDLAKPSDKRRKIVKNEKSEVTGTKTSEKQIIKAVKNVAESLGGDIKQTESELLVRLLNTKDGEKTSTNLSDLVKGMKIDQEQGVSGQTRAEQIKQALQSSTSEKRPYTERHQQRPTRPQKTDLVINKIDLFGSQPLGIFSKESLGNSEGVENKVWNKLYERDLKLAVTHPPSNYFQQMILWTEQGKVWKFPIDNEQGLEEEKKVHFSEHVFLEKHLEPWCPQKGPLRHFMELVCVGLSKNPYLTVEAKKEHIEWFKNYFEEKKQLLKDTGVLGNAGSDTKHSDQKQIE